MSTESGQISLEAPPTFSLENKTPYWLPRLSAKQRAIFNSFARYLLVSGPRRSGKTIGVLHKLVRHAFDVKGARVIMLAKNIKLAKEGGPWDDLINTVLPEWVASGILEVTTPPKLDAQTRSLYCEVSNRYGTTTRIYLGSLEFDDDVEKLLRGRKFSFVQIVEGTNFKKRSLFDTAVQCLRVGEPESSRQIVIDCNPATEGKEHWIYKLFWDERLAEEAPAHFKTDREKDSYREFQKSLEVIEVMVPDNPWLSQKETDELYGQFAHDQNLLLRYYFGQWVTASVGAIFAEQFNEQVHILGNIKFPNRADWEIALPPESATDMFTGWDLGMKNSVTAFACKETDEKGLPRYTFLDEIVVENDSVELEAYVEEVMKVIGKWEDFIGRPLMWRHWSDTSSWNRQLSAENHEAALIEDMSKRYVIKNNLSPSRVIRLQKVDKFRGSVMEGVKQMKRLLFENRLFVSANCVNLIEMFRSMEMERARGSGIERVPDSPYKHKFDAIRYLVQAESPIELHFNRVRVAKAPGRIISMG